MEKTIMSDSPPKSNEPSTENDGPQSALEMAALLKEPDPDRIDLEAKAFIAGRPEFGKILQFFNYARPHRTTLPTTATEFLREFLGADAPWPLIAIKDGDN
jgi:hypothetical protein